MVLEVCPACGDEYEPPWGGKCKRARMPLAKQPIKAEKCASEEEEETLTVMSAAAAAAVEVDGATAVPERPEWDEDDEEQALRKELAELSCSQRKATLCVAVAAERLKLSAILGGSAQAVVALAVPTVQEVADAGGGLPDPVTEMEAADQTAKQKG